MLQRCFCQIVLVGDGLQHFNGIHRSKHAYTNVTDAVANVILPDFPVSFTRGCAQLFLAPGSELLLAKHEMAHW